MKKLILIIGLLITLLPLQSAKAAEDSTSNTFYMNQVLNRPPENIPTLPNGTAIDQTNHMIFFVINAILLLSGITATFFITLNGVRLIFYAHDDDEIGNAKRAITWAIGGLFVVILSWTIVNNVVKVTYTPSGQGTGGCTSEGQACLSDGDCCSNNCASSPIKPAAGLGEVCQAR